MKVEMAQETVNRVVELKVRTALPYGVLCQGFGMPVSTVRRWRRRVACQRPVLYLPGPKKVAPVDLVALEKDTAALGHCRERSFGAPALVGKYAASVSRRDVYEMVSRYRKRLLQEARTALWRYEWNKVNVVWAMDDMEAERSFEGARLWVHNLQDLGSRYKFDPATGNTLLATVVATHLKETFEINGAPLFLKSDLGSNLVRSEAVRSVLQSYGVLPLLSPCHYPRYNGGVERCQGEMKIAIESLMGPTRCPAEHFKPYAVTASHNRNHIVRKSLGGQTACHVFTTRKNEMRFNKRERRNVYEWLIKTKDAILLSTGDRGKRAASAAWRTAVETWLVKNEVIRLLN